MSALDLIALRESALPTVHSFAYTYKLCGYRHASIIRTSRSPKVSPIYRDSELSSKNYTRVKHTRAQNIVGVASIPNYDSPNYWNESVLVFLRVLTWIDWEEVVSRVISTTWTTGAPLHQSRTFWVKFCVLEMLFIIRDDTKQPILMQVHACVLPVVTSSVTTAWVRNTVSNFIPKRRHW